jgi:hypothetical protein
MLGRNPALRRQLIHRLGELLGEFGQHLLSRHPGLLRQRVESVRAQCLLHTRGSHRLVRPRFDPRLRTPSLTGLLEFLDKLAEPTRQNAAGTAARKQVAKPAKPIRIPVLKSPSGCRPGRVEIAVGRPEQSAAFEGLICKEGEQAHRKRRHAPGVSRGAGLAARPVSHTFKNIHESH